MKRESNLGKRGGRGGRPGDEKKGDSDRGHSCFILKKGKSTRCAGRVWLVEQYSPKKHHCFPLDRGKRETKSWGEGSQSLRSVVKTSYQKSGGGASS